MLEDCTRWLPRWAEIEPDKVALITPDETVTFAELDERVARFANALGGLGIGHGDRVACMMQNSVEFVVTFFGTMRAGAVFVSVNTRLARPELAWILNDSEPALMVSESAFDAIISECADEVPVRTYVSTDRPLAVGSVWFGDVLASGAARFETPVAAMSDRAVINYTSGTTGYPKGSVLSHSALEHLMFNVVLTIGITRDDRSLLALPLCFTGGLVALCYPILSMGQTLVLEEEFDATRFIDLVHEHQITFTSCVPTMWRSIIEAVGDDASRLRSLRRGTVGAMPVPAPMLQWFEEQGISIMQAYGLTEGGGFNVILDERWAIQKLGSAGHGMATCEARVVDDAFEAVGRGEVGEVVLRGPTIMMEYWRNPEATAATFHEGWLRTGDLATTDDDGFITIVDRKKDLIITGGMNVYPAEVERVLYELDAVQEACVFGLPDEKWGERVTAAIVVKLDATLAIEDVDAHCTASLGSYKRPRQIDFVDELPRTVSGKYLKRVLRDRFYTAQSPA